MESLQNIVNHKLIIYEISKSMRKIGSLGHPQLVLFDFAFNKQFYLLISILIEDSNLIA